MCPRGHTYYLYITFIPHGIGLTFKDSRNRFQEIDSASLFSLAGRYDNPIPTRFLAPIDCYKILAQYAVIVTHVEDGR